MKLDSYLMREAFSNKNWTDALKIICRFAGLGDADAQTLANVSAVERSVFNEENSISIIFARVFASWTESDGFECIAIAREQKPSARIFLHET